MIPRWYTMPRRPVNEKKAVKSDPQRHRVYKMERELVGHCINVKMTKKDLQDIATHVCKDWGVPHARVYVYESRERTFGWTDGNAIHLNANFHGTNVQVLLHELAHHVTFYQDPDADDHGKEFMDVYADLMDHYKMMPRDCTIVLAARYGVEIAEGEDDE